MSLGLLDIIGLISLGAHFKDIRLEYSAGNVIYKGACIDHDRATDSSNWNIWKYTYSSGDLVRIEGPLTGAWDDRASLDWGA